jgi:hypothetical protein
MPFNEHPNLKAVTSKTVASLHMQNYHEARKFQSKKEKTNQPARKFINQLYFFQFKKDYKKFSEKSE